MQALANQIQAQGRGNDSVLVHMTPGEVSGLQALAQRHGGSLTRNPQTGLPEAGFLDDILPMLAGAVGGALGIDPWMVGAGVGAVTGLTTGNLEKGLMAGLGAYGGASLGAAFNPSGAIGGVGFGDRFMGPAGGSLATTRTGPAHGDVASSLIPDEAMASHSGFLSNGASTGADFYNPNSTAPYVPPTAAPTLKGPAPVTKPPNFIDRFSSAAGAGLGGGTFANIAPWAAGLGLLTPFLGQSGGTPMPKEENKTPFGGPYLPQERLLRDLPASKRLNRDSSEFDFFSPQNPYPGFTTEAERKARGYASGGTARAARAAPVGFPRSAAYAAPTVLVSAPKDSSERDYNFARSADLIAPAQPYVAPVVSPTASAPSTTPTSEREAGLAALAKQNPTATTAQLGDYERQIYGLNADQALKAALINQQRDAGTTQQNLGSSLTPQQQLAALPAEEQRKVNALSTQLQQGGGDPSATLSLMKAYSPASNMKEFQPWSPEFKGFDYMRDHPTDDFGNPIGWSLPEKAPYTTDANGVPSGWDPRDWENMKNFDPGSPSDEYILNNPWTYGMDTLGGNTMPGELRFNSVASNDSPRVENAYALGEFNAANDVARANGAANDQTALNYVIHGGPDASADASTPTPPASSGSSSFLNALNGVGDWAGSQFRSGEQAAPRSESSSSGLGGDYSGIGGFFRGLGDLTTGQWGNVARTLGSFVIPGAGVANMGLGALQGATGVRSPEGFQGNNSVLRWLSSGPSTESAAAALREGDVGNAFNYLVPLAQPTKQYAAGGVDLHDGSFVVDARTVSELGNGSSSAGQEILARLGGRPIHGPGDGVSDSIPANIGGNQEARVARDEVKFDPEAVARLGGGDQKKGSAKLYSIMKKAEKARKSASRGKDTGLRALVGAR